MTHARTRRHRPTKKLRSWLRAVVCLLAFGVSACATQHTITPLPGRPKPEDLSAVQVAARSVVSVVVEHATGGDAFGAGVIYDEQGHILTADHVVENAQRILLLIDGGYTVGAEVVGEDPIGDFALLKADTMIADRMQPAKLALAEPQPGESVWNIGNPFGTSRYGGEPSVGHGVVSAVHRTYLNEETGRLYLDSIQHDAPTNPGNSGGGIFNERGELLGVNALITTTRESPANSGVAFAIPSHVLNDKAQMMLNGRIPTHGWFGANEYKQATEVFPKGFGRLRAVFGELTPGGPAQMAGLKTGDVIIKVDGQELYGIHQVLMLEDAVIPGQEVRLTVNRAGRAMEFEIIASQRPWPMG